MRSLYFIFILTICIPAAVHSQVTATDSLRNKLKLVKTDSEKIALLNKLGAALRRNDINSSLAYSLEAVQLSQKLHLPLLEAQSLNVIGLTYKDQGKYPEALKCFLDALNLQEKNNADEKSISSSYNNIGTIFLRQKDFEKAISFYTKSLELKQKNKDKAGIADSYNNIGIVYAEMKDFQKALESMLKSLKIKEEIGEGKRLATSYANIGILYEETGELEKALEFQMKALELKKKNQDKNAMAASYDNIGNLYHKRKNPEMALVYYKLAVETANSNQYKEILKNAYKGLSAVYEDLNKTDSALFYFKLYADVKDSLLNLRGLDKIAELQTLYETEKKAKEIALLKKEKSLQLLMLSNNELEMKKQASEAEKRNIYISLLTKDQKIKEAELKEQKLLSEKKNEELKLLQQEKEFHRQELKRKATERYLFICAITLMLLLAGVGYRSYRNKRKAHLEIVKQKAAVEHQKLIIEEKQKEILDSIRYAERIQTALLTSEKYIARNMERLRGRN